MMKKHDSWYFVLTMTVTNT